MAKKRVIVGNTNPMSSTKESVETTHHTSTLLFGKTQYMYMGIGLLLIIIGFFLMSGGVQPNKETWDESIIYSFRRITLAPFVILVGLALQVVGIFKKG